MIISNSHKFVFIHIHKTAGTSVCEALSSLTHWNDIELGATEYGEKINRIYAKRFKLNKHSPAKNIRAVVGDQIWSEYFTFSIVRNPYSRILSFHNYIRRLEQDYEQRKQNNPNIGPPSYAEWPFYKAISKTNSFSEAIRHPQFFKAKASLPQSDFLTDPKTKKLDVDFVGRLEELETDFKYIADKVGLTEYNLGVANSSRGNSDLAIDSGTRDYIYKHYEADFDLLGYSKQYP